MLSSNLLALAITFILALIWLRINDFMAHQGWVSSDLSRKLIHIGTGPLFVLCWLLFNNQGSARFLAACVPLAITFQFILVGAGLWKDPDAVKAMSRSGERSEILRGPLFYGIVFVVLTIIFWKESPIGIIALMLLCGGDGFADVIGTRLRSGKLPWSKRKSWMGTIAMFVGGVAFSLIILEVFILAGVFQGPLANYLLPVIVIAAVGTLVESLPLADLDNITVPITAVALGLLFF